MENELRLYICEILLHLILYIVPKNESGIKLIKAILKYTKHEIYGEHGDI